MIYFATTLGNLRDAVNSLILVLGEDTPIANQRPTGLDNLIQLEWICVDAEFREVGDEADNYEQRLKPGERNAVKIS